jgi:hypothetical protein
MNIALEYAVLEPGPTQDGRFPLVVSNGPVACELDLFAPFGLPEANGQRRLFAALLRELAPVLAADETQAAFVPRIAESDWPWRIGIRLGRVSGIEASTPTAALAEAPGGPVVEGDPAYRLVLVGETDTVTLRTDRAGLESLGGQCRAASDAWRS